MYCDRCGTSLNPTSQFCSSCGKAVARVSPVYSGVPYAARSEDRVRRHLHRLATLWVVSGVLRLTMVLWLYGVGRYFPSFNFGPARMWAWSLWHGQVWDSILLILGLFGVAHLVLAWGLFERQPWARFLGLVLGVLALVRFPFGTVLGIYTIWVLAPESSSREYDQLAHSAQLGQA